MADMRILQGLRGHVEIPEGASILGSIEIPNGVDVRIAFEEIEGGWRLYVANAGQVQSIDLLHGEKGDTGNGIASAALNADYTLTITFTDGTTYTTPSLRGAKGDPGISPTVAITEITGGHRVTITDAAGAHSADVMDGRPGDPGDPGVSPAVTITEITGGHKITITDAAGTHSADVMNGRPGDPGDDGYSPTVTITTITGGHRVTITDATGAHSFDVMDGQGAVESVNGQTGTVVLDAGGIGYDDEETYDAGTTGKALSDLKTEIGELPTDVQVNGVSVVDAQGVANVPIATPTAPGVVTSGTITVTGSTPSITALPGIRYVCGEVATLDITLPASGIVDVVFESGATATVLTVTPPTGVTVRWANGLDPTSLEVNTTYEINIADGLGVAGSWT